MIIIDSLISIYIHAYSIHHEMNLKCCTIQGAMRLGTNIDKSRRHRKTTRLANKTLLRIVGKVTGIWQFSDDPDKHIPVSTTLYSEISFYKVSSP